MTASEQHRKVFIFQTFWVRRAEHVNSSTVLDASVTGADNLGAIGHFQANSLPIYMLASGR